MEESEEMKHSGAHRLMSGNHSKDSAGEAARAAAASRIVHDCREKESIPYGFRDTTDHS